MKLFFTGLLAVLMTTAVAESKPWKRHAIDSASKENEEWGADGVRLADANGDSLLDPFGVSLFTGRASG